MIIFRTLTLTLLICVAFATQASTNAVQLAKGKRLVNLEYLVDEQGSLTIDTILSAQKGGSLSSLNWKSLVNTSPNFGYTLSPYWFRFKIYNDSSMRADQILEISYPQLDYVDIFQFRTNQPMTQLHLGDRLEFSHRLVAHPNFIIPFELVPEEAVEFYIRVQSGGSLQVPLNLWQEESFYVSVGQEDQIHTFYYGILAVIVIINFFVFVALRERTYLYYALATLGYLILIGSLRAKTFQLFWPDAPWLHNQSLLMAIPLTLVFSALFTREFLHLESNAPKLDKLLKAIISLGALAVLGSFTLSYAASVRASVLLVIPSFLVLFSCGPLLWRRGVRAARYYSIAWGVLTIGGALSALNKYGVIPNSFITEYGLQIGSAFEAIILTIALAERLYREREQKVLAQAESIREHNERRHAEVRLMQQILHHPVTHLPNRASLEMAINDLSRSQKGRNFSVCLVHLARFQEINKTLGYNNADLVLEEVGRKLNQLAQAIVGVQFIEETDDDRFCVASFEAASFGVIFDNDILNANDESLPAVKERLFRPIEFKGMRLELSPAIGIAQYPEHGVDAATLIRHAHVALEAAEAQENRVAYYRPEQDRYNARRLTILSELKLAIVHDSLTLNFQPKFSVRDETLIGMEALLRWNHPRFGLIRPDEFIPVAEQTGIIKPLTRWVIEHALAVLQDLYRAGHHISMAINISASNLREADFVEFVSSAIQASALPAHQIILELTETAMMTDPVRSLAALEALANTGARISIDDFGTGYSSLAYIKKLPASEIKIDRSLIKEISSKSEDQVIVRATTQMCQQLGFKVVAEGVEDELTLRALKQIGCDLVQGYYLLPPLPLDRLVEWLCKDSHHKNAGSMPASA
ncbi:MAG: EAL domain-containing protein [Hahellaceae bacterium]|nr:EAL domain-containing protein [Hahellaceae bacterium]MCP5170518.1 EAL domain-containing protein [Hahellaceae bacterium]